jgi:diguanylate cyclase (GGDEF)-like protein
MSHRISSPSFLPPADADLRLERVQRQFRQAERMAGIGTWRLRLADNCCEWSDQVFAIHGLEPGAQPDLDAALDFYLPENRAMVAEAVARTIATGQPFSFETDLITARGARRRVRGMGEIELHDGLPIAVIGVFQDISEQYALQQRLSYAAATDDLTGLANRGAFTRHLGAQIVARRSSGGPLALLLIDLDGFKAVNDAFGHLAGDDVLGDIAAVLQRCGDANCYPARMGGDEFAMVVGDSGCARLDAIIGSLLADIRRPVRFGSTTIEVSASIGVAWLNGDVSDSRTLIARADAALYDAKRRGRGKARIYGSDELAPPRAAKRRALSAVG